MYSLEFSGTRAGQQHLPGAFPTGLKRVFLEVRGGFIGGFPIDEISGL